MLKFFVFFALALGTVFGVPALRARVMPIIEPPLEKLGLKERVSNPIKKRTASNEIKVLLQKLNEDMNEKKPLPSSLGFRPWIRANTRLAQRGIDPWGRTYYLINTKNHITVGSNGPDQIPGNDDDVKITVPFH